MSETITGNLGHVTAYAYAKAGGYTGTEAEYEAMMAGYTDAAEHAQDAAASAAAAAESAGTAGTAAETATGAAGEAAGSAEDAAESAAAAEEAKQYALAFMGAPLVATQAADMTDTSRIYVYHAIIAEAGYTNGHWYRYLDANNSWIDGGEYFTATVRTDTSLEVAGSPADAKATGDAIAAETAARTAADTALGDDVSDVKSAVTLSYEGTESFLLLGVFAVGGLNTDGTFKPTQTTRVSSASPQDTLVFDRDITVNVESGYAFGYIPMVDGTAGAWSGWKTAPFTIPANTNFLLQIRRDPEGTAEADVRTFVSALTFAVADTASVKALKAQVNAIPIAVPSAVGKFFEKGSIGGAGGDSTYREASRARSPILFFPNPAQLSIINTTYPNAKFSLLYFDADGNLLLNTSWLDDAYIPAGSFCRILISPLPTAGVAVTYTLEEILSCLSSSPVRKPAYNRPVKIASHQGNTYGADTNHCKLEGYIAAGKNGFDYAEGDIKFTSELIPVVSHDSTFVDATTGTTIRFSQHTLAELKTFDYFGGQVASLEEVILVCKKFGMGFILDQLGDDWSDAHYDAIFAVLKKHRFVQDAKFLCYGAGAAAKVLARCKTASIIAGQTHSSTDASAAIALANSIVTDDNHVDVLLANKLGEAVIAEAAASMDARFGLLTYHNDTVADKQTFGKYATILITNVNAALFND